MKDSICPSGWVEIEVIKKDGTVIKRGGKNEIHDQLKEEMAKSMFQTEGNFNINFNLFDIATFTTSIPNDKSGIIIKDTGGEKYQMATTMPGTAAKSFQVKGEVRNASGSTITISDAYLGHDTSSEAFGVQYSSYDFSANGGDQAVTDGQQLNITWSISIADDAG